MRLCATLSLAIPLALAQGGESPYFPETGSGAIHQRTLDILGGGVIVSLTLQPGFEDFPLLSRARMALGAQVVTVYVTNGEASPSDLSGDAPAEVAGARKEEAFQAMQLLGGDALFLNFPDPGLADTDDEVLDLWNADSLVSKLVPVLLSYRPDVVVVGRDCRSDSVSSPRMRALERCLTRALDAARSPSPGPDGRTPVAWTVPRVFVEHGRISTKSPYDQLHPVWKKTYRAIAAEAQDRYRTLRLQLPAWDSGGDRAYARGLKGEGIAGLDLLSGFPRLGKLGSTGAKLRKTLSRKDGGGAFRPLLSAAVSTVRDVSVAIARNTPGLGPGELRLAVHWKNRLEDLRCSLLDLKVDAAPSDSLLTDFQIFYLNLNGISGPFAASPYRIYFPEARNTERWTVNETQNWEFALTPPERFLILAHGGLPFTTPEGVFGTRASSMRVRFPYLIVHNDSLPEHNFGYHGEVLLRTGPRRSFQVFTPAIRLQNGERIVTGMLNFSRDPYAGRIAVRDSIAAGMSIPVRLDRKDQLRLDTLTLSFPRELPDGDYPVIVEIAGKGGIQATVTARKFSANADTTRNVLVLSGIEEPPVAAALRRLHVPRTVLPPSLLTGDALQRADVVLIDRDALADPQSGVALDAVRRWVRSGGRLVILPQFAAPRGGAGLFDWLEFSSSPQSPAGCSLVRDTTAVLLSRLNTLSATDWDGWVVARAWGSIVPRNDFRVDVRAKESGATLLATREEGKGVVTVVALDLVSQLMNIHPGAHRLLANLVGLPR